jgi:hypothetical protein
MSNIFEQATRQRLRFATCKGVMTTEDLWTMPLLSKDGFNLDTVAQTVDADLSAVAKTSFVAKVNPNKALHELKLEVVKFIIADKLAAQETASQAAARKAEKEKLLGVLDERKDAELKTLPIEEIQARIKALG